MRLLLLALTLGLPARAEARPLTLKRAERAIDLGLQAEMAGDYDGATAALISLVHTATQTVDTAGRERLLSFVDSIAARRRAFADHGKGAAGWSDAFSTLRPFGHRRSERFFAAAAKALELRGVPTVAIRFERTRAVSDPTAARRAVASVLEKSGMRVTHEAAARFIVRINVDAGEAKVSPSRARVTASASAIVRDKTMKEGESAGSIARTRSERRRKVAGARRFAVRRVLVDVGEGIVFAVRKRQLHQKPDASP